MADYFLAPSPSWCFLDNQGRPAVGGKLHTRRSDDHVTPLPVYENLDGTGEYPNPIILDGNGCITTPIYWESNPDSEDGLYYIWVEDADGNVIVPAIDKYPKTGNGGSTPPVEDNSDNSNHIINGNFHLTMDDIFGALSTQGLGGYSTVPVTPVPEGETYIAPGGGALTGTPKSDTVGSTQGYYLGGRFTASPNPILKTGWVFRKTGGPVTNDFLTFETPPIGEGLPDGPSANAPRYIQYEADVSTSSTLLEFTYVIADVRTLANEEVTLSFDCFSDVGSTSPVAAKIYQNFGTGGSPSAEVPTTVFQFSYPSGNQWARRSGSITLPSVSGKTIGANGDDHIRVSFQVPVNSPASIGKFGITNAQLQRGTFATPGFSYETFSETACKSILELIYGSLPKTGDMKFSMDINPANGWIVNEDDTTTIGSSTSTADYAGTETRNLYVLIWDRFDDAHAPVATGRGASALADFAANKKMTLPKISGRAIGAAGIGAGLTPRGLGNLVGTETHALTAAENGPHTHELTIPVLDTPNGAPVIVQNTSGTALNTVVLTTASSGSGTPHNIMQPTTFYYVHIKL